EASLSRTDELVKMFAEFPLALQRFLRDRPALALAEQRARERIEHRPEALLRLLERSVYGAPASPYRALLKRAGCEFDDARALVRSRGVDGGLRALRAEGVYVTYEGFKGRKPIVRGALELAVSERDFDNPGARRNFSLSTGGSTGLANKVYQDLDHIAALATFDMLALAEHGMLDAPTVHWTHMLPGRGIRFILRRAYHGDYRQDWFTPLGWRADRARLKDQLGTFYMLCCMRACGIRAAFPREVEPFEAIVVASHMRRVLDAE